MVLSINWLKIKFTALNKNSLKLAFWSYLKTCGSWTSCLNLKNSSSENPLLRWQRNLLFLAKECSYQKCLHLNVIGHFRSETLLIISLWPISSKQCLILLALICARFGETLDLPFTSLFFDFLTFWFLTSSLFLWALLTYFYLETP